jgi:amino-acid N-acetyltransferase
MIGQVRKAGMSDIAPLLALINGYAAKGIMLPRTEFEMSENIRDFSVLYSGADLIGCGALHFYSPVVGEVRSLAVDPHWTTHGAGRRVVEALIEEARQFSLDAVFAFTYVAGFFRKLGFHEVERGELPLKVWKDCLRCPKFQCCDEIAVVRVLEPEHWPGRHTPRQESEESVLLPIVI